MTRMGLVCLAFVVLCVAGCHDFIELPALGLVEIIALDTWAEGDGYELTAELLAISGGGEDTVQTGGPQSWVASAAGRTLLSALSHMTLRVTRRPFFQHTEAVVFGRELAERGLAGVLDPLTRDRRFRRTMRMVVADGTGREALEATSGLEDTAANTLTGLLETQQRLGFARAVTTNEFMVMLTSEAGAGFMPLIRAVQREEPRPAEDKPLMEMNGLGIFVGDKLVGTVEGPAARGVLWLRGELIRGGLSATFPGADRQVSAEYFRVNSRTRAAFVDGRPSIRVEIQGRLMLVEDGFDIPLHQKVPIMERLFEAEVRKEVETALDEVLRGMRADVFGFADALHRRDHRRWGAIADDWRDMLPDLDVRVDIDLQMRRLGTTTTKILFGGP